MGWIEREKGARLTRVPFKVVHSEQLPHNVFMKTEIEGPIDLQVYGVWASRGPGSERNYVHQVHMLLDKITISTTQYNVMLGDFNSNSIWDHEHGSRSHSSLVARLHALGLESTYHSYFKEQQGEETHPTIFHTRSREKPYHVDYLFLANPLLKRLTSVEVGDYEPWIKWSDHMPIVASLQNDLSE